MTEGEIDQLLAEMVVCWPRHQLTTPEAQLWRHQLGRLEAGPAFAAIGTLLESLSFWPAWAEFLPAYRDHKRRAQLARPSLPPADRTADEIEEARLRAKSAVQTMRETLAESRRSTSC